MKAAGKLGTMLALGLLISSPALPASAQDQGERASWPRELSDEYSNIIMYQPQLESFSGDKLEARAAVSVKTKDQEQPIFGAVWMEARLLTDTDTRLVTLESVKVTAAKFPDVEQEQVDKLSRLLEKEIPEWEFTMSLDQLLTAMEAIDQKAQVSDAIKNDPPEIIYVDYPSVLVPIDGEPILTDLERTGLKIVANTAFFIIYDPSNKKYFLKGGDDWFVAGDLMGKWQTTTSFPKSVTEVVKQVDAEVEKQKTEAQESGETPPTDQEGVGDAPTPEIIVRTKPAEIIETDGEPNLAPLADTELLYVTNTESDIAFDLGAQTYYLLISGRWYQSKDLKKGPWTYVPQEDLPEEFAKIPSDSDMSQVRVSVAGTQESREAVLENQIPQTAEVDRKTATVTVSWDGDPQFEKCSENVAYGKNSDKTVLLVGNKYYCCDEAIWFVSNRPDGGWEVATEVPKEVQEIPADCPAYNVKYVYIYDSTPDVVYVGYTPPYMGSYVYSGVVVYGTGWWYRPWWGAVYYPRPHTWGFHVHYNPYTGWGFSWGVSYGWLHISFGRPWYGGWWGAGGYRYGYRHGYHNGYRHGYYHGARAGYRAGYRAGQAQHHNNMYRNRASGIKRTGGRPATRPGGQPSAGTRPSTRPSTGARPPSTAKPQPKPSTKPNNHYADKNGNVYRNQGGNNWQKQNNKGGGYSNQKPSQRVQRDYSSRQRSQQRSAQPRQRSGGGGRRR